MELLLLIWIGGAAWAAGIASGKGRSGFGWFLLGLLFGPLAILVAAAMSRDDSEIARAGLQSGLLRRCPHCAEPIQSHATRCRYCGEKAPPPPPLTPQERIFGRRA
jgi:hypothetical protein